MVTTTSSSMTNKTAIIIGAGVAGLATAIRLAVQGFSVQVFEKNNYVGGKLTHFETHGFKFDAGPSLFTQPENIEELFALANEPIEPYFTYQKQPLACKYFYEDGTIINGYANAKQLATELQEKLGENPTAVEQYLQQSANTYNHIGNIFLNYSLHKISTLTKAPITKALRAVRPKFLFKTLHQTNTKNFKHPHTTQLFNRYATYNGSNPYKAPGMLSLIPHLEINEGTFYPKGGMISITNALYNLAIKKGVTFHLETPVQNIIYSNNTVMGVVANHTNYTANVVVSNMDVYFTYKHLLNKPQAANKILKQERSSSAFIFYWGINKIFPELQLHNIFFSNNYKAEFDSLFTTKTCYTDPTVYVNITSKCEPSLQAPAGKENWFVMVNAPANMGQNWQQYQQQYKQAIIKKLNSILQTNIEPLIEVEEVLSPVTIEANTNSYMGSLYGTSSNSKMAAFLRHANFTNSIKGLYFVGGSVHPGGGIPLCLKSAKIAAQIIQETQKKQHHA
jgi:phytoene desaturase